MMFVIVIMRLLEVLMLGLLAVETILAAVLIVAAYRAGLWGISVLGVLFLAAQWWLVLSSIKEGK